MKRKGQKMLDLNDDPSVACDNCEWVGRDSELSEIKSFSLRVEDGGEVPAGECPDCGSLAYLDYGKGGSE